MQHPGLMGKGVKLLVGLLRLREKKDEPGRSGSRSWEERIQERSPESGRFRLSLLTFITDNREGGHAHKHGDAQSEGWCSCKQVGPTNGVDHQAKDRCLPCLLSGQSWATDVLRCHCGPYGGGWGGYNLVNAWATPYLHQRSVTVFCSPSPAPDSALVILIPQPCHSISLTSQTSTLPGKDSAALPDLTL